MDKWTIEFNETGGYDCMTASFDISYDDRVIFKLDLGAWGQELCEPASIFIKTSAKSLALFLTNQLNLANVDPGIS